MGQNASCGENGSLDESASFDEKSALGENGLWGEKCPLGEKGSLAENGSYGMNFCKIETKSVRSKQNLYQNVLQNLHITALVYKSLFKCLC